ncbi:ubiquitin fusion degradation protein 1 homolog isoform X1 [Cajanus cajan]|uniref:ubiquitin fusion degradation protein 1 homolog isoform X1 n=1 Tax=Cajanus cajan TaxID=3821 RepID=UPI00098DB8B3|nr:ubiquitin fusion degradation protein 1 homolog isoform X1 [Cajanus cajan]
MFLDGYGYEGTSSFEQIYRCYSASFIEKSEIENGDKIIMPPSALDRLAFLRIDYPMMFELRNGASERVSHCGVLEFIADEGTIYMPYWMMQNMVLQEGDTVRVKYVSLPKGTYVKLQPHTKDFFDISNPKAILETTLRKFSCLTTGDTIMVTYNNKKYYIDVIETKPNNAISITETDCEVDFAPSLDYKPNTANKTLDNAKLNPFFGTGRRLDGNQIPNVNSLSSTTSSSPSFSRPSQGKIVFGSNFYRSKETGKEKTESKQEPPHQKQPRFQPFIGKKYSLKG